MKLYRFLSLSISSFRSQKVSGNESREEKEAFLQYDVVVRDMGRVEIDQIREVFRRINATRYALNAMEIHNARYEGEYKRFAESVAQKDFFDRHRVFRP